MNSMTDPDQVVVRRPERGRDSQRRTPNPDYSERLGRSGSPVKQHLSQTSSQNFGSGTNSFENVGIGFDCFNYGCSPSKPFSTHGGNESGPLNMSMNSGSHSKILSSEALRDIKTASLLEAPNSLAVKIDRVLNNRSPNKSPAITYGGYERGVIERQHHEIDLLMAELKQRDRELNELTSKHKSVVIDSQVEKKTFTQLAKQLKEKDEALTQRAEEIATINGKFRVLECEQANRKLLLATSQRQIETLNLELQQALERIKDLEEKNLILDGNGRELERTLNVLEEREKDVLAQLRRKEREISDRDVKIAEIEEKVHSMENSLRQGERTQQETDTKLIDKDRTIEKMEIALNTARSDTRIAQEQKGHLEKELNELKKELEDTRSQNDLLEAQLDQKEHNLISYRLKLRAAEEEIDTSKRRFEEQVDEHRQLFRMIQAAPYNTSRVSLYGPSSQDGLLSNSRHFGRESNSLTGSRISDMSLPNRTSRIENERTQSASVSTGRASALPTRNSHLLITASSAPNYSKASSRLSSDGLMNPLSYSSSFDQGHVRASGPPLRNGHHENDELRLDSLSPFDKLNSKGS